jgi:hypothetical protein
MLLPRSVKVKQTNFNVSWLGGEHNNKSYIGLQIYVMVLLSNFYMLN